MELRKAQQWDLLIRLVHDGGICAYLGADTSTTIDHFIDTHTLTWEKYSGSSSYPVPDPKLADIQKGMSPLLKMKAGRNIYEHTNFERKWVRGDYVDLRWELIEHLLAKCDIKEPVPVWMIKRDENGTVLVILTKL